MVVGVEIGGLATGPGPCFSVTPTVPGDSPQVLQLHVYHRLCAGGRAEAGGLWSQALLQGQVRGSVRLGLGQCKVGCRVGNLF